MTEKIIAIGALGGSGTRAVAAIFINLGFYMGDDLNNSNDNLLFTRMFKNPDWYRNSLNTQKRLRLQIFEKYMAGRSLDPYEFDELYYAVKTNLTHVTNLSSFKKWIESLYSTREKKNVWGWKEPNTQIFILEILEYFSKLKYIHVLRHGLDMAFSNNTQQLENWGWKFGIVLNGNETESELAVKQLDYWIESTKFILKNKTIHDDRILILNHSNFCTNQKTEIDKILDFCDLKPNIEILNNLYKIPKNTGSNNRYKNHKLNIFSAKQLEFVKGCGFEI